MGDATKTCKICNGTGIVQDELGEFKCVCMVAEIPTGSNEICDKIDYRELSSVESVLIDEGVIPEERVKDLYDSEVTRKYIDDIYTANGLKIIRYDIYEEMLNGILGKLRMGIPLGGSYIIGSPNGFGKTTFANTCIKVAASRGGKVVPAITLLELSDYILDKEQPAKKPKKYDEDGTEHKKKQEFTWHDYVNADIVFVELTDFNVRKAEVPTLSVLLKSRSYKSKPTIVLTTNPLKLYFSDINDKTYYWMEMVAIKNTSEKYDRLTHVSCFKGS